MQFIKVILIVVSMTSGMDVFSQTNASPKIMYVTSKEGLNQRERASINSKKVGVFLFGERIILYEKGPLITIDGVTNYWYRSRGTNGVCWVFGGYLSEELPVDAPVILGLWDDEDNWRQYYLFRPNGDYSEGYKETDMGLFGKWSLNGDMLELLIIGSMMAEEQGEPERVSILLTIIDRNNIVLNFSKDESANLKRNNDP